MFIFSRRGKRVVTQEEVVAKLDLLKLPTSYVFTPINLDEEKQKFIESETYSPNFKYKPVKNVNSSLLRELADITSISDVDPRISEFYLKLIESKSEVNDMLNAVGDNRLITEISRKRFGRPSARLFKNASLVLRGKVSNYDLVEQKKEGREYEYAEIERIMTKFLGELGFSDWTVAKSGRIADEAMKVGVKRKEVLLSGDISRSKIDLRKSIVHEIGTHVLRSYNGIHSGVPVLYKSNLPEYQDIEEGLATYNEELMKVLTFDALKRKATFSWLLYWGEAVSFRDLYNAMTAFLAKNLAFDFAYRVKRGLGDTSLPGLYYKDVVYFRGYRRVRKAIAKDSSLYEKLYAGKISMKQVSWVEDGLIPKAKLVLDPEKVNQIFKRLGI
ncbi:DUF1704 domain-containing protein [Candidatus Dojkabacteria bacterium]|nr:DUF1704 domain-containing protein [Candidatus Dojkabacteria bacterium]